MVDALNRHLAEKFKLGEQLQLLQSIGAMGLEIEESHPMPIMGSVRR
jgi:hypothetical protein